MTSIPKAFVTSFFQLITARQFAEAERVLERIKQKITMSERNKGYYQALYGMLLAQRNGDDRYAFLTSMDMSAKKELSESRREFLRQSQHLLNADYDRGFFEAWADYMRILAKILVPTVSTGNNSKNRGEEGTEPKNVEPAEQLAEALDVPEALEGKPEGQSSLTDFSEQ